MRMKNFLLLKIFAVFMLGANILTCSASTDKLTGVSDFEIGEFLYRRIKNMYRLALVPPPAIHPNTKNKICHYIIGSPFFSDVLEEKRVYMYQLYEKLKREQPDTFAKLYEPSPHPLGGRQRMIYTNPVRKVKVVFDLSNDGNLFEEYVFVCLAVSLRGTLIEYLVSREYNLGDSRDSYIPGRFVFYNASDTADDVATVYAVAEEPAKALSTPGVDVEGIFLRRRMQQPVEFEANDPVCRLTLAERLRVCTIVLSSAYFEGELKFIPRDQNVTKCTRKGISFRDERIREEASGEHDFAWMLSCRPDEYYATFQSVYYLSAPFSSNNEVFVYRHDDDLGIVLENLFGNVRSKI